MSTPNKLVYFQRYLEVVVEEPLLKRKNLMGLRGLLLITISKIFLFSSMGSSIVRKLKRSLLKDIRKTMFMLMCQ